jgi:hypothetical protein
VLSMWKQTEFISGKWGNKTKRRAIRMWGLNSLVINTERKPNLFIKLLLDEW